VGPICPRPLSCKGCGSPYELSTIVHAQFRLSHDKEAIIGVDEIEELICIECRKRIEWAMEFHLCDCPEGAEN